MDPIKFRNLAARQLPKETGVYALCDLDEVPIYVGMSVDGINVRVRRHLTSARSDVIANRQLDVWEIAYVWAWPVTAKRVIDTTRRKKITPAEMERIEVIERAIYHEHNSVSPLVNGSVVAKLSKIERKALVIPERSRIQVMPDDEIAARRQPARRLPRQADQFRNLLDHLLNVKNEVELRRALKAHFVRLDRYYRAFLNASADVSTSGGEGVTDED